MIKLLVNIALGLSLCAQVAYAQNASCEEFCNLKPSCPDVSQKCPLSQRCDCSQVEKNKASSAQ